jgi:dihydrofolate synthase/folylpolyglutamate synthase
MFENTKDLIAWIESQKRLTPKVSLERFRKICALFGSPEKKQKYLHVGGTNGKGSTVAYLKSILREAGYNVGSYISPYVLSFNERISYNDVFISDDELLQLGNEILAKYPLLEEEHLEKPSFFEFVTLLAFLYFSRIKDLDFVILEVGLGGLLDATNIITPLVSVITSISYDHMNVLGNTLQEIALNKLGIVKEGVPLVTFAVPEIFPQIREVTTEKKSPLILVDKQEIKNIEASLEATVFDYREFPRLKTRLLGFHQAENAALAVEVFKILQKDYGLSEEHLRKGLAKTFWPGRLQVLATDPVILLDGAHNIGGIESLVGFLKTMKKDFLRIVFAVSHDKAKEAMIPLLESVADEMVFSQYSYKRSDDAEILYALSKHSHKRVEVDPEKLYREALGEKNVTTVFCGSLYFVSDILRIYNAYSRLR